MAVQSSVVEANYLGQRVQRSILFEDIVTKT